MASAASDSDNYVYTRAQLKQKAAEQQIAIQSAEIDEKKAQIDYDGAAEKQEKGQELAKIDGVVTKVAESVESLETNEPYLVVQGSGGIMVQGNVSEMNLDKLTVGSHDHSERLGYRRNAHRRGDRDRHRRRPPTPTRTAARTRTTAPIRSRRQ